MKNKTSILAFVGLMIIISSIALACYDDHDYCDEHDCDDTTTTIETTTTTTETTTTIPETTTLPETTTTVQSCNYYFWFDNEHRVCGHKQFCGAYMYYGLNTFTTYSECHNALNAETTTTIPATTTTIQNNTTTSTTITTTTLIGSSSSQNTGGGSIHQFVPPYPTTTLIENSAVSTTTTMRKPSPSYPSSTVPFVCSINYSDINNSNKTPINNSAPGPTGAITGLVSSAAKDPLSLLGLIIAAACIAMMLILNNKNRG
jgi:hypothetical protein